MAGYLDAKGQSSPVIFNHENIQIQNFEMFRLHLKNIQIRFQGKKYRNRFTNIKVNYCIFSDIKNIGNSATPYLLFTYGRDNEIVNSYFFRDDEFFFGSAIYLYRVHDFEIRGSTIDGFFTKGIDIGGIGEKTASNHNLRSKNVVITKNFIRRYASSYENLYDDLKNEDHAIYAYHFVNVYMTKNEFHGWSPTADGGCAKIPNGEGALFEDNNCYGSGVLLL